MMKGVRIESVREDELASPANDQLRTLLDASFPETFHGRSYFKQLPHLRLLAWDGDAVVGQVGLDHRIINVGGRVLRIFGLIDLCVDTPHRGGGIASSLLGHALERATRSRLDFLVAMADRHDIYAAHGFQRVRPAMTRWMAIEDRQTVAVIEQDLSDCFLARPVAGTPWPAGPIDLLGYLF
jgi:predicted N-acetyltransferase YhbS